MADKTCDDCLFLGDRNYCYRIKYKVDCDSTACSLFMDFYKSDCCYNCANGTDKKVTFWCSANKKFIKEPDHFYCDKFIDE
ncbi:MAG: hypothetical protein IIT39_11035 [Clostridia bacterium]|nr:hypothetical protein [Clostridia bacterium]